MTTWNPTTLDSYDTSESIWQKLLQLGFFVTDTDSPPLVDGQQYLRSDDGTWHMLGLELVGGVNVPVVSQEAVESPGDQYLGDIILIASDLTNHKLSVANYGGEQVLRLDQEATETAGVSALTLTSSDANDYDLTAILYGGNYELQVEQPA